MHVNSLLVHWHKIEKHQTIQTSAIAHAWHVLPPFLFWELHMHSLIGYISLSLFFLSQFHCTFSRVPKPFTENPTEAQIYSSDNSPISPTVSFHISFSLSISVCIYIVAYVFIFLLNFIYIYFWSWRSVWVWQKPHELWIFSLWFCRFNELMVI